MAGHTAQEIAEVIQPQFADTDVALLASGIQRYQEIGAYCETPVMSLSLIHISAATRCLACLRARLFWRTAQNCWLKNCPPLPNMQ